MSYDFDYFVIGAGSGGIASARRAASYGARVGIAEYAPLGGTCVNRGCVPKKLLVYASRFPGEFKAATGYGWSPPQSDLDWSALITAVNNEVARLNGIYQRMLDNAEVKLYRTRAKLVDAHTIDVGQGETVTADKILLAVGGEPTKPPIPGIEHTLVSDDMFTLPEQPQRFLVLGGGYIGVEFAGILNGLGSDVSVIIRSDKVLRGFDEDLRDMVQASMIEKGIKIIAGNAPQKIEKTDDGLMVHLSETEEEMVIADAIALAALGRKPNIENLGLEAVGVKVENGAITVDDYHCTSVENIYAVGDCTDRVNLTPVAINEGRVLADTHFGNQPHQMSYQNIPSAVFSTPEAATVGLTEAEAHEQFGDAIKVYRSKFRPMYYTLPDLPEKTLMKLVVDGNTDKVLGAHMVGEHAAEIIQGVAIALKMGATKANFDATVGIHPSSAEEFVTMR